MTTLEQLIATKLTEPQRFWDDCADVFTSPAGLRVMHTLAAIAPPIGLADGQVSLRILASGKPLPPMPSPTPYEIGVDAGRQELSAVLWVRSQRTVLPQDAPKPS